MKRILLFLMVLASLFTLSSCGEKTPTTTPTEPNKTETPEKKPEVNADSEGFIIHYVRPDGEYTDWNVWIWEDLGEGNESGEQGAGYAFGTEVTEAGVECKTTWTEFGKSPENLTIGFIVRKGEWVATDTPEAGDRLISFKNLEYGEDGYYHIYLLSGDTQVYYSQIEVNDMITYFGYEYVPVVNKLRISLKTNREMGSFIIKSGNNVLVDSTKLNEETDTNIVEHTETSFKYKLSEMPDLNNVTVAEVTFKESGEKDESTADISSLYSSPMFEKQFAYDGDLGALYTAEKTTFRVWSPVSESITLRIYRSGTPAYLNPLGNNNFNEYTMTKGEKGTWEYTLNGDYAGYYYTYFVVNNNYPKGREVVDPYAKSTGVNGIRGMIVDFSKTNPEGWENVEIHNIPSTKLTVYETHVADVTSSTTWGGTESKAKLFTGMYETGTKYTSGTTTVSTGFDHIKELGVNAVQLLPIFDQANDERFENRVFNWGYNPLNYNSLDGIYSSDPYDGYVKIREFKELVKAYNAAGINIIMDVVYNHTASVGGTNFDVLMPGYYFRYNADGGLSNGSGCGNETASNMYMFKKFMVDSTEFWASEYKLGGFRFDLMEIHDTKTMDELATNLHENVGPNIAVYGEPWAGGSVAMPSTFTKANQAAMDSFKGYGAFNDQFRNALIKGGMGGFTNTGWITNNKQAVDVATVKLGIAGKTKTSNTDASKSIQYVTCHDNFTLYDRVVATEQGLDEATIKKMAVLANSVVLTSQGVTFFLAGEEFLRTKGGDHNSYSSSYQVNELDYSLKVKNQDMVEIYKKLIWLKQNNALLGDKVAGKINVQTYENDGSVIFYDLGDYIVFHHNGVGGDKPLSVAGTLYLDTLNPSSNVVPTTLKPYQTIIVKK